MLVDHLRRAGFASRRVSIELRGFAGALEHYRLHHFAHLGSSVRIRRLLRIGSPPRPAMGRYLRPAFRASRAGWYRVPPLATAEIAEMICTGVTLTSCPMASDPMEFADQLLTGRKQSAILSRQLDPRKLANPKRGCRLVELLIPKRAARA